MKIHESINEIMNELKAVKKNGKGKDYSYRGLDDIMNALKPLLVKNKVIIVPSVISKDREIKVTNKGTEMYVTVVEVEYTLIADDDSFLKVKSYGEAMDCGDKSMTKALSNAFKSALIETFCIPTQDVNDYYCGEDALGCYTSQAEPYHELPLYISTDQKLELCKVLEKKGFTAEYICEQFHINSLEDMNLKCYEVCMKKLSLSPDKEK